MQLIYVRPWQWDLNWANIENPAHNKWFQGLLDLLLFVFFFYLKRNTHFIIIQGFLDSSQTLKMQNEEGQITELYIPRKWYNIFIISYFFIVNGWFGYGIWTDLWIWFSSATNRLITAKDHASVQINVGHLDESGVYNGHFSTFALCGYVRAQVFTLYSIFGFFFCYYYYYLTLLDLCWFRRVK